MEEYRYRGRRGRRYRVQESDEMLVLRGRRAGRPSEQCTKRSRRVLDALERVCEFPEAGVEVFRTHPARPTPDRDAAIAELDRDRGLRFVGRCLADRHSARPVIYTENLFVKFRDDASHAVIRRVLRKHGLRVKRRLAYATNALFVAARAGSGRRVFGIAAKLLDDHDEVELSHPELIRERRSRAAFSQQWHLRATEIGGGLIDAHASVEAAWELARGAGVTIAVIDDGVDVDHVEFRAEGGIVAPRDLTRDSDDPRPKFARDNHGTACAGVACAAGLDGASGVAPAAALMPLRLASGLGSQDEADAFVWAAQNGADVISCSWGPIDGRWWDPNDPAHRQVVPLPDSTRLAIEFATSEGRAGSGCVIVWAAGNGNEPVDNDGYAGHPAVIAVGACNDRGLRSVYSDFGAALWCCFPSSDVEGARTPGIWTTDRVGVAGYNPGTPSLGHTAGDYTNDFGGTSSAAPGVAGVAALLLSRQAGLTVSEVRELIAVSCDRIDDEHGAYDDDGHSPLYGHGRINALRVLQNGDRFIFRGEA